MIVDVGRLLINSSIVSYRILVRQCDQRPSTARFEMSFHVDRSFAAIFRSCISDLHQSTISSIHSLHGLPPLLILSAMSKSNTYVFRLLPSSILQMWPNSCNFLCILFAVMGQSRLSVFHKVLYRFLCLSNWPTVSLCSSTLNANSFSQLHVVVGVGVNRIHSADATQLDSR